MRVVGHPDTTLQASLGWDTFEQTSLWQLLTAELSRRGSELVTDHVLLPVMGLVDPKQHQEALTGLLGLCARVPPVLRLLEHVLALPAPFGRFP